jgi:hypothetical protein
MIDRSDIDDVVSAHFHETDDIAIIVLDALTEKEYDEIITNIINGEAVYEAISDLIVDEFKKIAVKKLIKMYA